MPDRGGLPPDARQAEGHTIAGFAAWRGQPPAGLARTVAAALSRVRAGVAGGRNLSRRFGPGWCVALLDILVRGLVAHARFFDITHRFHVPPDSRPTGHDPAATSEGVPHDHHAPAT